MRLLICHCLWKVPLKRDPIGTLLCILVLCVPSRSPKTSRILLLSEMAAAKKNTEIQFIHDKPAPGLFMSHDGKEILRCREVPLGSGYFIHEPLKPSRS